MRLTPFEQQSIKAILGQFDPLADVFLFGSRVDDHRRGGDIDLFVQTTCPMDLKSQLQARWELEVACDTQVDLLIKTPDQAEEPIHIITRQKGVRL